MPAHILIRYAIAVAVALSASGVAAKEVTLKRNDLVINAQLELADGKNLSEGAIVITHGGLAHNGMEVVTYLQSLLKAKGYSTLAINLSLGIDNRHGMYDCKLTHRHRNADAADEIGAWVDWLKQQGAKRVVVLGHSRGGAQTALYAAEHDDPAVKAVVLMSPATRENSDAADYRERTHKPLAPALARAEKMVAVGKGASVIDGVGLMSCPNTAATAESFVSYYGPDPRLDTPYLIPKIKPPILVVVAGGDEVVVGVDKKIAPLADGKHVRMKVIDGADHFYRDLYADDAVDAIGAFLKEVGY